MSKEKTKRAAAAFALIALAATVAAGCVLKAPGVKQRPLALSELSEPERTAIYHHGGVIIARGSLHNHTTFSDGCRSPEDLLKMAQREGVAVLAYTDHREGKLCFKNVVCLDADCVENVGFDVYYDRLRQIQAQAAEIGMIALKGIEASPPYFYNQGKSPNLALVGINRHFTVYNIEDPEVFANMPVRRDVDTLKPEPEPGDTPYQEFIDYMVEHGGIVHAVHVESAMDSWYGPVHAISPAPVWNLHLKNLTSFSVLPEAWHQRTGAPGGVWDTVLAEYLAGMRPRPLWAVGDADYHGPDASLVRATTLFYLREFTEAEVYNCMREGRTVALQGEAFQDVYVAEWSVGDGEAPRGQVMHGAELRMGAAPAIRFALNRPVPNTRTRLIRNGLVIQEVEGTALTYVDRDWASKREPVYYRVEVIGPVDPAGHDPNAPTQPESELLVNPIFVRSNN